MRYYILGLIMIIAFSCGKKAENQTEQPTTTEEGSSTQPADVTATAKDTAAVDSVQLVGEKVYNQYCFACHQRDGSGVPSMYPPLKSSDWVTGDKTKLIKVVLNGLSGDIQVNGQKYSQVMPTHGFLKDEEVAGVLTYLRKNFGNSGEAITKEEVADVRAAK